MINDASEQYEKVKQTFDSQAAAEKYARHKNIDTARNRREVAAILRCLQLAGQDVSGKCIDIPCGTFRLAKILLGKNASVTAADYSTAMLDQARSMAAATMPEEEVSFVQADIRATGFADRSFDLVICNRLFHHYAESSDRLKVLSELARISNRVVIVSFFDRASFSSYLRSLKHWIAGRVQQDRFGISRQQFCAEARMAGLEPIAYVATRRFCSAQTYVALNAGKREAMGA